MQIIKTEYSFRQVFAPVEKVIERLTAIGETHALIADTTTFGHVRFERECRAAGIVPFFGARLLVEVEHEQWRWIVITARDPEILYRFVSSDKTHDDLFAAASDGLQILSQIPIPLADFGLLMPSSCSAARAVFHDEIPFVAASESDYPAPDDRDAFLMVADRQGKPFPSHILSDDERRAIYGAAVLEASLKSERDLVSVLEGSALNHAQLIQAPGDLRELVEARLPDWMKSRPEYRERIEHELEIIFEKGFESYFLVVSDMVDFAKQKMVVGPGRGSAAGSLVCYVLGITGVDPIRHDLLFARFIDPNRDDLPDIDIDFQFDRREMVFEYLRDKYGSERVARLGSVNTLKPRSLVNIIAEKFGLLDSQKFSIRDRIVEYPPGDHRHGHSVAAALPDELPQFAAAPENHAWHAGQHAAGVLVSNHALTRFCSVVDGVAQIDKNDAEEIGLLKIDALGLTTLTILSEAVGDDVFRQFSIDDAKLLDIFNQRKFAGVFQFDGQALRHFASQINFESFDDVDQLTALARPGPMDSGAAQRWIDVKTGRSEPIYLHESLKPIIEKTNGIILFQEQVMQIIRQIGGFDWPRVTTVRRLIGKSKGAEAINEHRAAFIDGAASHGIDEETALAIWDEIVSFGRYGMNASHTCAYAYISMACAYAKTVNPVGFAVAVLRAFDDKQKQIAILRELRAEGIGFVPFDVEKSGVDWSTDGERIIGGFSNIVGVGPVKARQMVERRDAGMLTPVDLKLIESAQYEIGSATEAHDLFGDWYDDPAAHGVNGAIVELSDFQNGDYSAGVVIVKVEKRELRSENEPDRVARRGYEMPEYQSKFYNLRAVDDSVTAPVLVRVGAKLLPYLDDEEIKTGKWFLIRGKWLAQYNMLSVNKIKKLQ